MSEIVLEGVSKHYGAVRAVDNVSLRADAGKFLVLLGPSGCGKSTVLRLIAGLEEVTAGKVFIGGRDVTRLDPDKRRVSMVFQSYALFPHLNVYENIAFGLRRKKVDKSDIDKRVRDAMTLVDLIGFESRKPPQMSGGQQQRVALARALVNHPKVLLLDEPLGALDMKLRKQMQLELKSIQQEVGITFIYVTHDQEEAMTMSDRLAVMRHGKIDQIGPPEAVYETPATEFVAGFLGASNMLDGEVKETNNGRTTIALSTGGTVTTNTSGVPAGISAVRVGVRPEKITIVPDDGNAPADRNTVTGLLRMSTYIGVNYQYKVEGPGGHELTVYVQNLGGEGSQPVPGQRVRLEWLPEHTFVVEPSATPISEEEEEA
jgi:spermidine/putrescine transport system ATP-binding protein